jgi:hypothetical protein
VFDFIKTIEDGSRAAHLVLLCVVEQFANVISGKDTSLLGCWWISFPDDWLALTGTISRTPMMNRRESAMMVDLEQDGERQDSF